MVVVRRLERDFFPGAFFNVFCGVDVSLPCRLSKCGYVVRTVVKTQAAGPRPPAIRAFSVGQIQGVHIRQRIIRIADQLPVDQVFRFHNG